MQILPILPVEAGDIAPIEVGECGLGHGRSFAIKRDGRRSLNAGRSVMSPDWIIYAKVLGSLILSQLEQLLGPTLLVLH
jgi:hypothetical protein